MILYPSQFTNSQLHREIDRATQLCIINKLIEFNSVGMSGFIQSVSPDWMKEINSLCLCGEKKILFAITTDVFVLNKL